MQTKTSFLLWTAIGMAAPSAQAFAASYQYMLISIPGAFSTAARALNDSGTVVGDYQASDGHHCFFYENGTITSFDPPGSTYCDGEGIAADGTIVGSFQVNGQRRDDGFTYKSGVFTTYGHAGYDTQIYAISPNGTAIGSSTNDRTKTSRIFEIQDGLEKNEAVAAYAQQGFNAVNDAGTAVGYYYTTTSGSRGLIDHAGRLSGTSVPEGESVNVVDINSRGVFVGTYADEISGLLVGYVNQHGVITSVSNPNRHQTFLGGINDRGSITGTSLPITGQAGEAFVIHSGVMTILQPPGAPSYSDVSAGAINNAGQILGNYFDASENLVSFLAIPSG